MFITHFFLIVFWLLFGMIHSVLASNGVKRPLINMLNVKETTFRIGYNLIAIFTLFLVIYYQIRIESVLLFETSTFTFLLSLVLITIGIVVMGICMTKYFKQMAGLVEEIPILEISGIHKYVRHPLYLGTFLFIIGLLLSFPTISNFIGVTMIIIYTFIGIYFEEKKLIKTFGYSYINYRHTVPMIIPMFLKSKIIE